MSLDQQKSIRLSSDLLERITKAAEADGRSVNGWIRYVLERHLTVEDALSG